MGLEVEDCFTVFTGKMLTMSTCDFRTNSFHPINLGGCEDNFFYNKEEPCANSYNVSKVLIHYTGALFCTIDITVAILAHVGKIYSRIPSYIRNTLL